jgi:hypothetical protein
LIKAESVCLSLALFALFSFMSISDKLHRKVLKIAHINICSLRNKVHEIHNLLTSDNIHILAIYETHLDNSFDDTSVAIQGYNIYRRDRNDFWGGVAVYIQSHIPVMLRGDLMSSVIEVLWLQVHLAHLKPLLGYCYRPPSANSQYLNNMCEMLNSVCDVNREVYFLADLNIDWFSSSCAFNFVRVILFGLLINLPGCLGTRSSTCIDHIFTNAVEICSKAVSVPIGCNDHNIVAISRKAKVPTAGPKIVYKRSYKIFCCYS